MKYNPPPGEVADAPYVDGNRSAGIKGSVVPAAAIEFGQRELVHLINFAGLSPDNGDLEQVRKAIQGMIAAATGGGDTADYVLLSQARTRLPIFPEILTADGRINVASPGAGSILVPPTVACQHRGIAPFNTSDYSEPARTFATVPSKTYHLRWRPSDGFVMIDLTDAIYNPGGLKAEGDPAFDTTFDDMLVARVVTNAANVATVTNLANKPVLTLNLSKTTYQTSSNVGSERGPDTAPVQSVNWSRQPVCHWQEFKVGPGTGALLDSIVNMFFDATRYTCRPQVVGFFQNDNGSRGTIDGTYRVTLRS